MQEEKSQDTEEKTSCNEEDILLEELARPLVDKYLNEKKESAFNEVEK